MTVLGQNNNNKLWICQCSCENKTIVEVKRGHLTSGNTKSCGCILRENIIKKNKDKKRKITEKEKDSIIESYLKGKTINYIGGKFHLQSHMIKNILKERNIEIRQKIYNNYFEQIDTEEKAYWLGFLYADGSINKSAVDLTLQERDKNHLEKFLYSIHADVLIKDKNVILNNKEYKNKRITIHDSKMVLDLIKCGCTENKSFTIRFPDKDIPNNLRNHFIRGYFDGDGSISKSRNQWSWNIISNEYFLKEIQNILVNEIGLNFTKLISKKSSLIKSLSYGGSHNIYKIYNYLYKNATIYLQRKYDKYQEFLLSYSKKYLQKEKNKLIVICGFSSSGKDKITKHIANNYNYSEIISYTSRPIRPNESECNPYHFITKKQFEVMLSNNEFIECRTYNTLVNNIPDIWYYGVSKESIDLSKHNYIVVLDILGLIQFKKHYKDNIISFFINVDEQTRKQRCINREDFDETEWNRRYLDDKEKFTEEVINREVDYVIENYDFDKCVNKIISLIGGVLS